MATNNEELMKKFNRADSNTKELILFVAFHHGHELSVDRKVVIAIA